MKYQFLKAKKKDHFYIFIMVRLCPNKFERFFWLKEEVVMFYGNGTVWNKYPSCERCNSDVENILCVYHEKLKNGLLPFSDEIKHWSFNNG